MTLTLRYAARSDRGLIRDGNQDSVYAGPRLLAVADGMGGMAAGDVASNITIAAMAPLDEDVPGDALVDALRSAVDTANQQLRDAVDANPALEGMGTTLTAMLFSGSKFGMVHVGDSRAYLLRDGEFVQVTKDDTYVQMLVDEGRISAEEASSHPQRSLLTRALDGRDIDPEYSVRQAVPGDRYLLCSDGLTAVVSGETIAQSMREYTDPGQCVERLVQLALRGGGPDNVTVIIADVTDGDIVEQRPLVGGAAARDRGMVPSVEGSTPASRASALQAPRAAAPEQPAPEEEPRPKRHPLRTSALLAVVLVVLGGLLWGGWTWSQAQYYVGATPDGMVAVFQGVPGQIAGVHLSKVHHSSATKIGDLTRVAQDKVKQGIPANNEQDAQRKLNDLIDPANGNVVPDCPSPSVSPVAPTSAPPSPTGSPDPSSSQSLSPSPSGSPSSGAPVSDPSSTKVTTRTTIQGSVSPSPDPVTIPSSSGC
ncbi:protein phosphatase 2C domain-containing protein [Rugosimonospora acidiphila]|uniref:Protein phosphatase 2C domain-containing protein n=1 Tax=Rugosimonospora acidiphila TaxID=556531 RepID=A0ABP9RGT8_9ACTN